MKFLRCGLLVLVVLGCGRPQPGGGTSRQPPPSEERQASVDTPREPTVEDATAVLRAYYDAINAERYGDAYACWARQGEASRQTFDDFEAGFAHTDSVRAEIGEPSEIGAAAGSRYITIPVRITAHSREGTETYSGTYTLRRSVVDGATLEQRLWRIDSANLRRER